MPNDLQRLVEAPELLTAIHAAAAELLGVELRVADPWKDTVDRLIAWGVLAPPGYLHWKRRLYLPIEPRWAPPFVEGEVGWRHVTWCCVATTPTGYPASTACAISSRVRSVLRASACSLIRESCSWSEVVKHPHDHRNSGVNNVSGPHSHVQMTPRSPLLHAASTTITDSALEWISFAR